VRMTISSPSDSIPVKLPTIAELIAQRGHSRHSLSKKLQVTTGTIFQVLVGVPHGLQYACERIAKCLDERPSIIQAALEETWRQAALKAPDLLLEPEDLSELRALVETSPSESRVRGTRNRSFSGITQGELSKRSRIAPMTISKIENRACWATQQTIYALTRGLGLDPSNPNHLARVRHACHFGCSQT